MTVQADLCPTSEYRFSRVLTPSHLLCRLQAATPFLEEMRTERRNDLTARNTLSSSVEPEAIMLQMTVHLASVGPTLTERHQNHRMTSKVMSIIRAVAEQHARLLLTFVNIGPNSICNPKHYAHTSFCLDVIQNKITEP